jgi:hypothetical protein
MIACSDGLLDYDAIVQQTGCSASADTLECLRTVPYATLKAAQDASPFIFAYQVYNFNAALNFAYWNIVLGTGLAAA